MTWRFMDYIIQVTENINSYFSTEIFFIGDLKIYQLTHFSVKTSLYCLSSVYAFQFYPSLSNALVLYIPLSSSLLLYIHFYTS